MSLYNYEKPWLFNLKGVAFILMGIIAMIQVKYTLPVLLLIFALLLGFNVFLRFGEVFWLKVEKNRTQNLFLGSISILFIILFVTTFNNFDLYSNKIDTSRLSAFIVIVIWLVFSAVISLIEAVLLLLKKLSTAYVFVIDFILLSLLSYFLYVAVIQAADLSKALFVFGILSTGIGGVSIALGKLLSNLANK
jgi:hypothetical protein